MPRGARPQRDEGVEVIAVPWLDLEGLGQAIGLRPSAVVKSRIRPGPPRYTMFRRVVTKVAVPDRFFTWIPAAVRAARKALRSNSIVLGSGQRSAYVVARLAHGERPLIADLNDLWSSNPQRPVGKVRNRIDELMETWALKDADRLTTVNELIAEEWQRRLDRQVASIHSGFDPGDFPPLSPSRRNGPVRLVYSGTVYFTFDLTPLYEAIRSGLVEGWLRNDSLELSFIGRLSERVVHESKELGISQFFRVCGPIDHDELLKKLVQADALILPVFEADPYALPMKFFEYVGAGRPILALGPANRLASRTVVEHGLGIGLHDTEGVNEFLRSVVGDRSALPVPDPGAREMFTWQRSVDRLAAIVLELSEEELVEA